MGTFHETKYVHKKINIHPLHPLWETFFPCKNKHFPFLNSHPQHPNNLQWCPWELPVQRNLQTYLHRGQCASSWWGTRKESRQLSVGRTSIPLTLGLYAAFCSGMRTNPLPPRLAWTVSTNAQLGYRWFSSSPPSLKRSAEAVGACQTTRPQ